MPTAKYSSGTPVEHPLPKGTIVRVKGRKFEFTINRPIYDEDEVVGYWLTDPNQAQAAIRLEKIKT